MATRVAFAAGPRAGFISTPRVRRERCSRARPGRPTRVVAGVGPQDVASEETIALPETLDAFATRVCQRVGRGEEDARLIVSTLRANWFETAEDVSPLTVNQLVAMGVPARWGQAMFDLTREEADAARLTSAEDAATASDAAGGSAPAVTRASDTGWIGGALPGPDARLERPTTGRQAARSRAWGNHGGMRGAKKNDGAIALSGVRVTKRKRLPPYALRDAEVPESLRKELEEMRRDVTTRRVGGGRAPVRGTTAANYEEVARGLMGWLVRVKRGGWDGVSFVEEASSRERSDVRNPRGSLGSPEANVPEGLSLRDAFPDEGASGARFAFEYLRWLRSARAVAASTEAFQLRSLIAIAKWVHHNRRGGGADSGGFENPAVAELVSAQRGGATLALKSARVADESAKWLDWPAYLNVVETLKHECAPLTRSGVRRSDADIAMAVQRYLLFAVLASVPDRQRTLRELRLGKTLFCETRDEGVGGGGGEDARDANANATRVSSKPQRWWIVRHAPEDYKTGNAYGARPDLALDRRLYPALEQWLFGSDLDEIAADADASDDASFDFERYSASGHRAALSPTHDFVFTRPNGSPWTVSELSRTFSRASLRITGKKTNPHLIRDMVVTHVRGEGIASDAELEALAMYMGHSVAMQKGTYDRRTAQQKVAPAVGLMSAINARAGPTSKRKA